MPIGATIGAAAIGGAATLGAGAAASNAQAKSASNALDYQKQIRTDVQPYLNAGTSALGEISDPNAIAKNYVQSPGYQWQLSQGLNAVSTNKATNELLRSGSAMEGLNNYAQGAASTDFNNWWNQQYDMANLGKSAEGIAAGVADNSSNIAQGAGTAAANSDITTGNNVTNLSGSLAQILGNQAAAASTASSYSNPSTGFNASDSGGTISYGGGPG